jgi:hypothetical protein
MSRSRLIVSTLLAGTAALAAACGAPGDVTTLELHEVTSGYYDEGIVDGENKIVPSMTFRLRNKGGEPVSSVQLNVYFRVEGADGDMDEQFVRAIGGDGLAPQQATPPITVRSKVGYKGQQSRAEMLTNSQFRDVRVRVFGKSGSGQWAPLGESLVERRIITR